MPRHGIVNDPDTAVLPEVPVTVNHVPVDGVYPSTLMSSKVYSNLKVAVAEIVVP
jgi:hypothetical protein